VTDESPGDIPFLRAHRRTNQPRGGRPNNTNAFRHGKRSASVVAARKALNALMRKVRAGLAQAKG
jgi:hypothetical protein